MKLTEKQIEIISLIKRGNTDGTLLDIDQILERLSYMPTKQALQFSLRYIIKRGYIQKHPDLQLRRNKKRVCYYATTISNPI